MGNECEHLKLFEMAVSCIDTSRDLSSREVRMSKQDIYDLFGYHTHSKYKFFREALEDLQQQVVKFDLEKDRRASIVLVPYIEWGTKDDDDEVLLKFSEEIMPFLIDFKNGHFTQYEIAELKYMKSQYSIVLFKYFVMEYNKRIKHSRNGVVEVFVSLEDLRFITDTQKKYSKPNSLTEKIVNVTINEINGIGSELPTTSYLLKYDIKRGKYNRIEGYYFSIRRRMNITDRDF